MTLGATMTAKKINFNAGPSVLPDSILEKAQAELLNTGGTGLSVLEMSHRAKEFEDILARAENGVRKNMGVPDSHAILFLGGGASLQFSMVPMNLAQKGKPVDVVHTGMWTKKALEEIKKLSEMRLAASGEASKFTALPQWET